MANDVAGQEQAASATKPARIEEIIMFNHVLVPTNGTPLSDHAIRMGFRLASTVNAKVTCFHVMPELRGITYKTGILEGTRKKFARDPMAHAAQFLSAIEKTAKAAGAPASIDQAEHQSRLTLYLWLPATWWDARPSAIA